MIEQATTPFPYSALSTFPLILRIIATIIFLALTFRSLIYPFIGLVKVSGDTTLGWVESLKTLILPTSFHVLGIMKQYKTIASLTTNVDNQPKTPMEAPDDIIQQLTEIRARLAFLEEARNNSPTTSHNPAIYSPIRPTTPIVSPLAPRRR